MNHSYLTIILLAAALCSCTPKEQTLRIEAGNIKVTAVDKIDGAAEVRAILARDKAYIDSIKSPVLGEAAVALEKYIPESPLMNFAADALMEMAQQHSDRKVDIAEQTCLPYTGRRAIDTAMQGDCQGWRRSDKRNAFGNNKRWRASECDGRRQSH